MRICHCKSIHGEMQITCICICCHKLYCHLLELRSNECINISFSVITVFLNAHFLLCSTDRVISVCKQDRKCRSLCQVTFRS